MTTNMGLLTPLERDLLALEPKYRRRNRRGITKAEKRCQSCNTTESPEWRRGPGGSGSLCNACGLHFAKLIKKKVNAAPSLSLKSAIEIASKVSGDPNVTPTLTLSAGEQQQQQGLNSVTTSGSGGNESSTPMQIETPTAPNNAAPVPVNNSVTSPLSATSEATSTTTATAPLSAGAASMASSGTEKTRERDEDDTMLDRESPKIPKLD